MCLEILVQLNRNGPVPIGTGRLEAISGLRLKKADLDGQAAFRVSTDGTCSCGFLSDDADFDSDRWILADDRLEALAKISEALLAEKVRFRFLVHWLGGERQRESTTVKAAELARDIRANQVRNNVLYEVRS